MPDQESNHHCNAERARPWLAWLLNGRLHQLAAVSPRHPSSRRASSGLEELTSGRTFSRNWAGRFRERSNPAVAQECRDVLGNRAVHGWRVVAVKPKPRLQLVGVKLQHFG
jgi:hypothetical protein